MLFNTFWIAVFLADIIVVSGELVQNIITMENIVFILKKQTRIHFVYGFAFLVT